MLRKHYILNNGAVFLLPTVNQSLNVFAFSIFGNNRRDKTQLSLYDVHQQSGSTPVAVNPRMNGDEAEVRFKTQPITCRHIVSIHRCQFPV